jgi:DNA-binding response OmpR family regulator
MIMEMDAGTPRVRILIADGEPCVVAPLQRRLEEAGYHVFVTTCGAQALAEAEREPPRLALLDCDLPGRVSGFRVAETLRRSHDVPVMFYSTWQGAQYARAAELVGALRWLPKSMPIEEVLVHIQDAVRDQTAVHVRTRPSPDQYREWDTRAKKEHLIGIYTAVWSETPEHVKSVLNRFSRRNNIPLERLAEIQALYQRQAAQLHREYESKLAAMRPQELLALHRFHDKLCEVRDASDRDSIPAEREPSGMQHRPA